MSFALFIIDTDAYIKSIFSNNIENLSLNEAFYHLRKSREQRLRVI